MAYFRIKELKDVLTQLGLSKQGKKQVKCLGKVSFGILKSTLVLVVKICLEDVAIFVGLMILLYSFSSLLISFVNVGVISSLF